MRVCTWARRRVLHPCLDCRGALCRQLPSIPAMPHHWISCRVRVAAATVSLPLESLSPQWLRGSVRSRCAPCLLHVHDAEYVAQWHEDERKGCLRAISSCCRKSACACVLCAPRLTCSTSLRDPSLLSFAVHIHSFPQSLEPDMRQLSPAACFDQSPQPVRP